MTEEIKNSFVEQLKKDLSRDFGEPLFGGVLSPSKSQIMILAFLIRERSVR